MATVAVPSRSQLRTSGLLQALRVLAILVALTVTLVPVLWIALTSIKPPSEWVSDPPVWFTSTPTLVSYTQMWSEGGADAFRNSLITVSGATICAMVLGTIAAYSMSRFGTGGQNFANWVLSLRFLPPVVFAIPLLQLFQQFALVDTYQGLILLYTVANLPFVIWMMKGYFDEVPHELEEAARIDGTDDLGAFRHVALPLSLPGLVTTTLLTFTFGWSEFFYAVVFTTKERFTVPVRLSQYFSEAVGLQWGPQAALSVVAMVPVIAISLFIQRYLVRAMTLGALKE